MCHSILYDSRKPDISFRADGLIEIYAHIAHVLNLSPGDVVDIVMRDGEWLLYPKLRAGQYCGRHEATLRATSKNRHGGTLRAWSQRLCRKMISLSGTDDPSRVRLACGEPFTDDRGITFIPIIYRYRL